MFVCTNQRTVLQEICYNNKKTLKYCIIDFQQHTYFTNGVINLVSRIAKMQQTHQLLIEKYAQLKSENHAIISEEEIHIICYQKVYSSWTQRFQVTVELQDSTIQDCLVKWQSVNDKKVSFTQDTLFRSHLRSSIKKLLN